MASFGYEAVNSNGKEVKGSVEADSIELAKDEVKKQGLMLVSIAEQSALTKDISIDLGGKPKTRDLCVFCRQFVSMIRAGVTIIDALKMLGEQTENKKLQKALVQVRVDVEKGETLADSMRKFPKIFPSIMMNMVSAGEASGNLDTSFDRVAVQLERASKTQSLVKKAMIYPIVVAIVAVVVVIVMLVKVVPTYTDMFEQLDTELPAITKAVVAASDFLLQKWFIILGIIIAAVVGIKTFKMTDMGKHFFDKVALSIPLVKDLIIKTATSQMARTLSTLMGAGVPMVEAVGIVADTMNNIWFKEALTDVRNEVILGVPISQPIEKCGLFPAMAYHMIRIGEESGDIESMLDKVADYYDEEVEIAVQSMMAAMEPLIIIILAAIVGVLIGAVMAPMMKMYSAMDAL